MQAKGGFWSWQFSPLDMIGAVGTVTFTAVSVTMWSMSTFQSKVDANEMQAQTDNRFVNTESRINALDAKVETVRGSLDGVAKDVSYIRGRLEPKAN